MLKYYDKAILKGNPMAMVNLGNYYRRNENIEEALRYYKMAVDMGSTVAMNNLASFYQSLGDYENMIKYCDMIIEFVNTSPSIQLKEKYKEDCSNDI